MSKNHVLFALILTAGSTACIEPADDLSSAELHATAVSYYACDDSDCVQTRSLDSRADATLACDGDGCMMRSDTSSPYLQHDYVARTTALQLELWRDGIDEYGADQDAAFPPWGPSSEPVFVDPDCMFDLNQEIGTDHCDNHPGPAPTPQPPPGPDSCTNGELDCTLCSAKLLQCTSSCLALPIGKFACMGVCSWRYVNCAQDKCDC